MKKTLVMVAIIVVLPLSAAETPGGVTLCSTEGELNFNLGMPAYEIHSLDNGEARIVMDALNSSYSGQTGYPRLPTTTYTFALPPGSTLESVSFSGNRSPIPGEYIIEACLPPMPLSPSSLITEEFVREYTETKARVYAGQEPLSLKLGEIRAAAERREYSLVTVTVYPFFTDPVTSTVSFADDISVSIRYKPVDAEHAAFISRFLETGTLSPDVPEHVLNKEDARRWYQPENRLLASPRMLILTTDAIKNSTAAKIGLYREWRSYNGFYSSIVTKEEISASASGVDLPQKIRNWLRDNATNYDYLFIIGHHGDIPMRILTPFNNDCKYDPDVTPDPSDIYYGDLSKSDLSSWNKDGDNYYGEVMSGAGFYDPQDAPDLEMELHVGRINSSSATDIGNILERTWLFEYDEDAAYKQASVLAGGVLWYDNENGTGWPGFDGAYYMEYLMDNSIIARSSAATLYEKAGDGPSIYACDADLTKTNLVDALIEDPGIFVENNHGWYNSFVRAVWNDDGDGIPDTLDITHPEALKTTDAWKLEAGKANVAFLLSCLNGKPEADPCLAQALLNFGSVAVVAHTRSALGKFGWSKYTDGGQNALYYYVLDNYLNKPEVYDYVLGDAVDAGRLTYYGQEGWNYSRFINTYGHVIFGDPALRHFGRQGSLPIGVTEEEPVLSSPSLAVDAAHKITFSLPVANIIRLEVWDVTGRKVGTLKQGHCPAGIHTLVWDTDNLSAGSYFITLKADALTRTAKAVVLH